MDTILETKLIRLFNVKPDSSLLQNKYLTLTKIKTDNFKQLFNLSIEKQLDGLNWDNVLAYNFEKILTIMNDNLTTQEARHYFRKNNNTVNLCIYGLTQLELEQKIKDIYDVIVLNNPHDIVCYRNHDLIYIVSNNPDYYCPIKINSYIYHSPTEILITQKNDSSSVGYDGDNLWATQRGKMAIDNKEFDFDDTKVDLNNLYMWQFDPELIDSLMNNNLDIINNKLYQAFEDKNYFLFGRIIKLSGIIPNDLFIKLWSFEHILFLQELINFQNLTKYINDNDLYNQMLIDDNPEMAHLMTIMGYVVNKNIDYFETVFKHSKIRSLVYLLDIHKITRYDYLKLVDNTLPESQMFIKKAGELIPELIKVNP